MATPKMISCRVEKFSYDIEMSIDSLIEQLQQDRARFIEEGWSKLALRRPYLYGLRMETDEEAEAREAKEQEFSARRAAQERAEFERLSKLYGKK